MKKIALVSHGCAKNLVDSELILGLLADNGYEITLDENETDIVIVNTNGYVNHINAEGIGLVNLHLGGGRAMKESVIRTLVLWFK